MARDPDASVEPVEIPEGFPPLPPTLGNPLTADSHRLTSPMMINTTTLIKKY